MTRVHSFQNVLGLGRRQPLVLKRCCNVSRFQRVRSNHLVAKNRVQHRFTSSPLGLGNRHLPSRRGVVRPVTCIAQPYSASSLSQSALTSAVYPLKRFLDETIGRMGLSSIEWQTFLPMSGLFCTMVFVNTIVNNLATSLVITAPGGGAAVVPFLTSYIAFPLTTAATVLYAYASHFMSHKRLFTITVGIFAACNLLFAMCLIPNSEALRLPAIANTLTQVLPSGLSGVAGMIRNWTFSVFYCLSGMWSDIGISLLFWSFANDITSSKQAHIVYPLMGIGANMAQVLGGIVLKMCSVGGAAAYSSCSQLLLFQVVGCMVAVMGIHHYMTSQIDQKKKQMKTSSKPQRTRIDSSTELQIVGGETQASKSMMGQRIGYITGVCESQQSRAVSATEVASYTIFPRNGRMMSTIFRRAHKPMDTLTKPVHALATMPLINIQVSSVKCDCKPVKKKPAKKSQKKKPTFMDSLKTLKDSAAVQSLGVMTIAQSLSLTLIEFVWRSQLRLVCPTPAAFSACLGDIATATGVLTGAMMCVSPILFNKMGWKGVANLTPVVMTFGGVAFFALCSAFHIFGQIGMTAVAQKILPITHVTGAFLFVLAKATKYALSKPCKEIVYIKMDEAQRTKGKAAVDVVGSNLGKSGGSLLQQALLLASGGHLMMITPVMFAAYASMMHGWNRSVHTLSTLQEGAAPPEDKVISRPLKESEISEIDEEESTIIGVGVNQEEVCLAAEFSLSQNPNNLESGNVRSYPVSV